MTKKIKIFYSYSHKDEALKEILDTHLSILRRKNIIDTWSDRKIIPGQPWDLEIEKEIEKADLILLLISADFIASDFCYEKEVTKAVEFHKKGEKTLVPILLRECDWLGAPFERIQGLPSDMRAITSKHWHNLDEAFNNVIQGLKKSINEIQINTLNLEAKTKIQSTDSKFITPRKTPFKFEGELKNNRPHGFGVAFFDNGDSYRGFWKNGVMHGNGFYLWESGEEYFGNFKNHVMHGRGVFIFANGASHFGMFKNEQRDGYGMMLDSKNELILVGKWREGLFEE